ncbi:DNA cytosine methyltransferase, partial [Enterobacter hormaechei subsp. steigerwaltii]|nr:DNA cytosine methyltransferase [Enterobacter hormaechei subsp. steigerwaltii]
PGAGDAISDRVNGMAYSNHRISDEGETLRTGRNAVLDGSSANRLGDTNLTRLEGLGRNDSSAGWEGATGSVAAPGFHDGLAYTDNKQHSIAISGCGNEHVSAGRQQDPAALAGLRRDYRALEVNGFWRDADWLLCRDGKWRPVEPGTFPLVDGAAARLGRV